MAEPDDFLQARTPALHERRGGKHLFVWGDLGQWLVVDDEAAVLLDCFGRRRPVKEAIGEYARRIGREPGRAADEARPVVDALVARGILARNRATPPPPVQRLKVSNLTFNITNRCNLRCSWCYNPHGVDRETPISDLVRWLARGGDALDDQGAFIILGGEPFLDTARLLETVEGVREVIRGDILVSTNGTQECKAVAAALARLNVTVQISLDSPIARRHDAVRGAGVFRRATANAKRLAEAGVPTVLSMVMTRGSEDDLEAYFDLAIELGVGEVRFIPLRRIGAGTDQPDAVPDLRGCFRRMVEIVRRRPELARLLRRDYFSILMTACRFSRLRGDCGIASRCLFVDATGDVFPCPNHRGSEYRCGDVWTLPLERVFDSPVLERVRARYQLANMRECRQCALRYWCAGDCRAEALSVAGDANAPSPYCRAIREIVPEMFWLIAEGWQSLGRPEQEFMPWG